MHPPGHNAPQSPSVAGNDLSIGHRTDVGMVREANEDALGMRAPDDPELLSLRGMLFVVADGMGGVAGGATASHIAVDVVLGEYFERAPEGSINAALLHAFEAANQAVHTAAFDDPGHHGMGTTATALALNRRSATIAHVGDSRAYLIRDGLIVQITEDHSLVQSLVKGGSITKREAREHELANVITRCIGPQREVDIDVIGPIEAWVDDRFVLCSDGLHSLLTNNEIAEMAGASTPQLACEAMVDKVNERGGHDNITVQIILIDG